MKNFFYHENMLYIREYIHGRQSAGGFTVHIEGPFEDGEGEQWARIRTTYMNPKDKHFNKKIARRRALEKEPVAVRVRELPEAVARAKIRAVSGPKGYTPFEDEIKQQSARYNFLLKNFV